jgi:hypothetical protein
MALAGGHAWQVCRSRSRRAERGTRQGSGVYLEEPVAHLHYLENGLLRRWWMFGDAEKAKRRFLAGDRPDEGYS